MDKVADMSIYILMITFVFSKVNKGEEKLPSLKKANRHNI